MDKVLYLHLHRYLTRVLNSENAISDQSNHFLNNLYDEIDILTNGDEVQHSLAMYRCLSLIDNCILSHFADFSPVTKMLDKYSSLFADSYVFGMLKIVVSLHSGRIVSLFYISSHVLGLFTRAYRIFKTLEIKSLQLDTLGYLLSDHALELFSFPECESMYIESSSLYASNNRDTWGLISQSLEDQSFSSVIDFYEFSEKLEKSIQHVAIETNFIKLNIIKLSIPDLLKLSTSDKITRSLELISSTSGCISDNRDLKIFDTIDATGNLKKVLNQLKKFKVRELEKIQY